MDNYPANSHKAKTVEPETTPNPKKIEKIVEGDVVRRKKPLGKKFASVFLGGEASSVWEYILTDVLVPAAKDVISDAFSQGIDRFLFGDSRPSSRRSNHRSSNSGYTSYNRYTSSNNTVPGWAKRDEPRTNLSSRARATHDFDEIILATRQEGDEVLERLYDLISTYKAASVADLYELVGVSSSYTDDKWGWTDLHGANVSRIRSGGYLLNLPKPESLD